MANPEANLRVRRRGKEEVADHLMINETGAASPAGRRLTGGGG